jgi:hypothetical protein
MLSALSMLSAGKRRADEGWVISADAGVPMTDA